MPFTSHRDIFERLASVSSVASLSPEERMQYDYDLKKARDYNAEMKYARTRGLEEGLAEGRAKGHAEGRAEGRAEQTLQIARAMKLNGISAELISASTGLSHDEISKL